MQPKGKLPLARIKTLNYGKDNIARSAVVTTRSVELTRPAVKLAPVFAPLDAEDFRA